MPKTKIVPKNKYMRVSHNLSNDMRIIHKVMTVNIIQVLIMTFTSEQILALP